MVLPLSLVAVSAVLLPSELSRSASAAGVPPVVAVAAIALLALEVVVVVVTASVVNDVFASFAA